LEIGAEVVSQKVAITEVKAEEGGETPARPLSIQQIIRTQFGSEGEIAIAVAMAESRMNPKAYHINSNGSVDCGLFQINSIHKPTKEQCENPEENVKMAYEIYKRGSWNAWSAYNNKSYYKYLTEL
jgi:hypothetical protein